MNDFNAIKKVPAVKLSKAAKAQVERIMKWEDDSLEHVLGKEEAEKYRREMYGKR